MSAQNQTHEALQEFLHLRELTLDLLKNSSVEFLASSPSVELSPCWKQFRHIARVQENYTQALNTGWINFSTDFSCYAGGGEQTALLRYLQTTNTDMLKAVGNFQAEKNIEWFGKACSLECHLLRLATHESLHHGQLLLYARSARIALPVSWSAWGA